MNITEIEKEIQNVLEQTEKLREKSEMECETADFLKKQCEKLEERANSKTLNDDERELVQKQINAMHRKLVLEVESIEADIPKLDALEAKLNRLISLAHKAMENV